MGRGYKQLEITLLVANSAFSVCSNALCILIYVQCSMSLGL